MKERFNDNLEIQGDMREDIHNGELSWYPKTWHTEETGEQLSCLDCGLMFSTFDLYDDRCSACDKAAQDKEEEMKERNTDADK